MKETTITCDCCQKVLNVQGICYLQLDFMVCGFIPNLEDIDCKYLTPSHYCDMVCLRKKLDDELHE